MDHTKDTDYSHLSTSKVRAMRGWDDNLRELHSAEVVGPAAEKGNGEEEEEYQHRNGMGRHQGR